MSGLASVWLEFGVLQSVAESYLDQYVGFGGRFSIDAVLEFGGNHPLFNPNGQGATRLTSVQANSFISQYNIVVHYPSDASGLSCTLFQNKTTGEYTLSFRSTEYQIQDKGGDWERDGIDGADGEISGQGFALAQLSSMEAFYRNLKQGKTWNAKSGQWETNPDVADFAKGNLVLNITGYSLGAHLSTAFTLMHWNEVTDTYNFNAAGLGGFGADNAIPDGAGISLLVHIYDTLMAYRAGDPVPTDSWWNDWVTHSGDFDSYMETVKATEGHAHPNLYDDPLHDVVMDLLAPLMYPTGVTGMGWQRFDNSMLNWLVSRGSGQGNRMKEVADIS